MKPRPGSLCRWTDDEGHQVGWMIVIDVHGETELYDVDGNPYWGVTAFWHDGAVAWFNLRPTNIVIL